MEILAKNSKQCAQSMLRENKMQVALTAKLFSRLTVLFTSTSVSIFKIPVGKGETIEGLCKPIKTEASPTTNTTANVLHMAV